MKKCHCGLPEHYPNLMTEKFATEMIAKLGEFVPITSLETGVTYKVPRQYLAAHVIKKGQLDKLKFEKYEI